MTYSDEEIEERITAAIDGFGAHPERHKAKNMSAPDREKRAREMLIANKKNSRETGRAMSGSARKS